MTTIIPSDAFVKWHINQWFDGVLQYDPLCGSRDGHSTFTVPYGQHHEIERWINSHSTMGLVCSTYKEWRKHRGRTWFRTEVKFEFQLRADAIRAKLTIGGEA